MQKNIKGWGRATRAAVGLIVFVAGVYYRSGQGALGLFPLAEDNGIGWDTPERVRTNLA